MYENVIIKKKCNTMMIADTMVFLGDIPGYTGDTTNGPTKIWT
jgi:hypothetical protein